MLLAGCGSHTTTTGILVVGLETAAPQYTQSLLVTLSGGPSSPAPQIVNNPGLSDATFGKLLPGAYTVTVTAYDSIDGAGKVTGNGSANAAVSAGQTTPLAVSLVGTGAN
jgi:hypothetical protein